MSRSTDDLHPATAFRLNVVFKAMEAYGYPLMIVRTYDTLAKQSKLYAQGRTLPGRIVTKIKRGWHNIRVGGVPCARATDVAFKKQRRFPDRDNWDRDWPWDRLKKIARACDLDIPIEWDKGHLIDRQDQTFKEAWDDSDQC